MQKVVVVVLIKISVDFHISYGSANELEYQIILSIDLQFISFENGQLLLSQIEEVMLQLSQKYGVKLSTCAEPIVKEGISQEACLSVNAINQMLGTSIPQTETGK